MTKNSMLDFDLGSRVFPVSTASEKAQHLFDLGLSWCFGFNQDEGLACFKAAAALDPQCAMLHWGIAYAAGPFYNMPWRDFGEIEASECTAFCRGHIDKALSLSGSATALEVGLIGALAQRIQKSYPVSHEEFDRWDDAYADAMRKINDDFPDNLDVMAFFVEAMMTRTPWHLWDVERGCPTPGADTIEAITVCERAITLADQLGAPQHPAVLHLHIHLLEMSPEPERAMNSADRLGGLCPDAGHIHHMPGHIYALCGEYEKARIVSEHAIAVDREYLAYAGPHNYYTTSRCHDLHLMMYACMMLGQFGPALGAAEEICENLTEDVINLKDKPFIRFTMEGYFSMKVHALVRFGKWHQIVEAPMPANPDLYCVSTSMHHYAKGVAHAALKAFDKAEEQNTQFSESLKRITPDRRFFNNSALQTLGVGEKLLLGELEYHRGNHEIAFDHLREAVKRSDSLHYSEPWPWMHPPRHVLGALLMEQGQHEEAEKVYREDLGLTNSVVRCAQHPNNVWALHGLVECLTIRGEKEELAKFKTVLNSAIAKADVAVTSSCCCREEVRNLPG